MIFRFDDVSINTDTGRLGAKIALIKDEVPDVKILLGISSLVFSQRQLGAEWERVHPRILTAMSSLSNYYRGQQCGRPEILKSTDRQIMFAGHGIVHVDHRLLSFQTQELSILTSCALANDAKAFIPPYNKWNKDTEEICFKHGIELVRFEDGWSHVAYNPFQRSRPLYYMHPYDMTVAELKEWFRR